MASLAPPFNLQKWVEDNRHLLKPPVGNKEVYTESGDFIVMVVGGPNARKDYHIDAGEEIFYQLEGQIEVGIIGDSGPEIHKVGPGDMFLVPGYVPHQPRRGPNTIGLVIERKRTTEELDGFAWYCEKCGNGLHKEFVQVTDIVKDLPLVMERFWENDHLRTCKRCGTYMEKPLTP